MAAGLVVDLDDATVGNLVDFGSLGLISWDGALTLVVTSFPSAGRCGCVDNQCVSIGICISVFIVW
ncbi:hypothetical protein D3C80_2212730 [compost metagenome]